MTSLFLARYLGFSSSFSFLYVCSIVSSLQTSLVYLALLRAFKGLLKGFKRVCKGLKKEKTDLEINFRRSFFLNFGPWTPDFLIFDLKFGFYVKNPAQNRLEMSQIRFLGEKTAKLMFVICLFFLNPIVRLAGNKETY